jgi:Polysaccharide lyase family 4, domain II
VGDRILKPALTALVVALAAAPAAAGGATGRVVGTVTVTGGEPAGAIVYLIGFSEPPPDDVPSVVQRNKHFVPDLLAITAGQTITFPNADPILHNVFSRSATRPFDLGSYRRGDTKDKSFPAAGVVDVYCNIHPEMAATILVLPNRRFARVAADGSFTIDGVPPGTWTAFAYARLVVRPTQVKVTVSAGADATIHLELQRGAEPAHLNKYGEKYRDPTKYRN